MASSNPSSLRKFVAPEVVFGEDALDLVGQYAMNLGSSKALVVTDPGVMAAGWTDTAIASLEKSGLEHVTYSAVSSNPRADEMAAGAELYMRENCDVVVTVGGGSVTDCGKGIGIEVSHRRPVLEFEGVDQLTEPLPPMVCIPTTGGTSADVSQFAIITDMASKRKIAVISKAVVPDVSLIDPRTLTTMDSYLTACTGIDAMVHAIEAFVSIGRSPITDQHALEAIRLVSGSLLDSIANPEDVEKRSNVMLGSLQAGLAFSNASLGGVHAMAHSLGGWLDLPHGECNAMLLDHVMAFNFTEAGDRYKQIGEAFGLQLSKTTAKEARAAVLGRVRSLRKEAGILKTLSQRGVHRTEVGDLAGNAMRDPCMLTNPRRPKRRDIEVIYEESL